MHDAIAEQRLWHVFIEGRRLRYEVIYNSSGPAQGQNLKPPVRARRDGWFVRTTALEALFQVNTKGRLCGAHSLAGQARWCGSDGASMAHMGAPMIQAWSIN